MGVVGGEDVEVEWVACEVRPARAGGSRSKSERERKGEWGGGWEAVPAHGDSFEGGVWGEYKPRQGWARAVLQFLE
jgi:hypothetical protein